MLELGLQCLEIAEELDAPILKTPAHCGLGHTSMGMGKFDSAAQHQAAAMALYDKAHHYQHLETIGLDSGAFAAAAGSLVQCCLGNLD